MKLETNNPPSFCHRYSHRILNQKIINNIFKLLNKIIEIAHAQFYIINNLL